MASIRSLLAAAALVAAGAQPTSCQGTPNVLPVWTGEPTLVSKTTNGLRFALSAPLNNDSVPLNVVHVYGTQYEMGFAYGNLMKAEISTLLPQVMLYLEAQLNQSIPAWVPPQYREAILTYGLEYALDMTYNATKPYTPAYHYETLQGIADGAGRNFSELVRMSMIPELIKAACSIVVAWGEATTAGAAAGKPVQLRALDWDTGGPFQQFPTLLTFHPNAGNGVAFTTLGWAGMLGSITGMSSSGMGVGEKVWDAYSETQNIFGYVWTFLLQDILQFDGDVDAAFSRIATANRTCSIWIGLTDKLSNTGKVVQYSDESVTFFNDRSFPTYPEHDAFTNLIFVNKHVQPSSDACMNDLMHYVYGHVDGPALVQYVAAMEQTGDMHIAVFDWNNDWMYVSNAGLADAQGNAQPAFERQFVRLSMDGLWNTTMAQYA